MVSTLVLWLPFYVSRDFLTVYKQWDGPLYIIPAKTLYEVSKFFYPDGGFILSLPLSPGYFAAHLPLYSLVIRFFAIFMGYLRAMLFSNVISTILLSCFFIFFLIKLKLTQKPLLLASVFLFLPRFLIVRATGSPESLFMLMVLVSLYFHEKENFFLSGFFGGLAAITKLPGLILFPAYVAVAIEQFSSAHTFKPKRMWAFLIPLFVVLVFMFYQYRFGDFFAYFTAQKDNHFQLFGWYPFAGFNSSKQWIGDAWLEANMLYFILYGLAVTYLWKIKERSLFYFSLLYFVALLFVQHRDISRYALPLWPFTLIAFQQFITQKKVVVTLLILLPGIYLYAINFMHYNVMPISDWLPFR